MTYAHVCHVASPLSVFQTLTTSSIRNERLSYPPPMDSFHHTSITMAKRPCPCVSSSTTIATASAQNHMFPNLNPQTDHLLHAFLSLADSPSHSLDFCLDRLLDSATCDANQSVLIDRAHKLSSVLLDAANRAARKRASTHNSLTWPLPPDLTIKVFSMLDTQSLCFAAASCSMFNKCAMDPLCYANIDLTTVVPKVNNAVVSTMIQRAGRVLESLKLGIVPGPTSSPGSCQPLVYTIRNSVEVSKFSWTDKKPRHGKESSILTRSCLNSLSGDNSAAGHVELRQTLMSVSMFCPLIERLFFESSKTGRDDSLKSPTCVALVNNCPNLTSLALRGFKLHDFKVRILLKGFRKLKYVDFSMSYSISGMFLRNLGSSLGGHLLEVLILRDCMHLREVEVARLLTAILSGDFKFLRHLDISNREGLASEGDWYQRCYNSSLIPVRQVLQERPGMCLLAEFPSEGSFIDLDSDLNSEISLPSQLSSHTSDGSSFTSSSDSSYSSDRSSGNDENRDSGFVILEESSDEVDFLPG
ncbi:F-box protein SKIP17-like isoform X2 [Tripterygium wilfordii]|uniref:F-box protein SKIP17-like isoform X2 n=1 Tax=Tripterygium wilfordii TaxID=458696 RepID=UPI0018F80202|nr:F-box protein SKIP17-like isoform X2 [Tripterygium wilfordii]